MSKLKKVINILVKNKKKSEDELQMDENELIEHKIVEYELIQHNRVQPWFAAKGDQTLRLDYDLNSDSTVLDIGGYKGEFAADIFCKYNANIYVFEPIQSFFEIIVNKFSHNEKVKPYNFGLAGKDEQMEISMSDNSSSIFLKTEQTQTIQLKSITNFIKENNIAHVDLIKINIEGGEYELLESLIENNLIGIFTNIQVQFHDFLLEDGKERMNKIQEHLSETHELTYQYEFVWENWKLK